MEPNDITIKILQEIRDEGRGMRGDLQGLRSDMVSRFEQSDLRFAAVESTLKELAEQMVMLSRGIKTALEARGDVARRLDDHEQRLRVLEVPDEH